MTARDRSAGGIGTDRIRRIVAAAQRAPSGDNCQPWTFRWNGALLKVNHDGQLARHLINHAEHGSLLALGCVLEAISVAAAAEGLVAEASLEELTGHWATVRFSPARGGDLAEAHTLAAALERRGTDRRLYRGGSLSHPVFGALQREAARFEACQLHLLGRFSRELMDYIVRADGYMLRHEDAYRDVLRWVRLSQREVEETRDGVSWRTFGFELPETSLLRLLRSPRTWPVMNSVGMHRAMRLWGRLQLLSSAALLCITVRSRRREALVAAGRLGFAAWLRLQRAGWGVQPLTQQSLCVYNLATVGLPPGTRPEFLTLFQEGADVLARAFGYRDGVLPVWMFRTGHSSPLPERLRTFRRPLETVLIEE